MVFAFVNLWSDDSTYALNNHQIYFIAHYLVMILIFLFYRQSKWIRLRIPPQVRK